MLSLSTVLVWGPAILGSKDTSAVDGLLCLMGDHGWRMGGCQQHCDEEICQAGGRDQHLNNSQTLASDSRQAEWLPSVQQSACYTPNLCRYALGETPVCRWKSVRKKAIS